MIEISLKDTNNKSNGHESFFQRRTVLHVLMGLPILIWSSLVTYSITKSLPVLWKLLLVGVFACPYYFEIDRDKGICQTGIIFTVRNRWLTDSPQMLLEMRIRGKKSKFRQVCFGPKKETSDGKYEVKGSWLNPLRRVDPNDYYTGWFPWPNLTGCLDGKPPEEQAVFYALVEDTVLEPINWLEVNFALSEDQKSAPRPLRCVSGTKWTEADLLCRRTTFVVGLPVALAIGFLGGVRWWKHRIGT